MGRWSARYFCAFDSLCEAVFLKQFFRQDFALPILLGMILVLPDTAYAITATDQISADSDDAGNGSVVDITDDINANTVWAILFSAKMP